MTTATATPAPELAALRSEIASLEADSSALKATLATAEAQLQSNEAEQVEVSEAIVRGTRKPLESVAILRRSEEIMASVVGLRRLMAKNQAQLDEIYPMMRRIEAENLLAQRRSKMETLRQKAAEVAERLNQRFAVILTEDLPALDAIRDQLTGDLRDIGGQQVALQVIRMVTDEMGVLVEEFKLTDNRDWARHPAAWDVRGDLILTLRNMRKYR